MHNYTATRTAAHCTKLLLLLLLLLSYY